MSYKIKKLIEVIKVANECSVALAVEIDEQNLRQEKMMKNEIEVIKLLSIYFLNLMYCLGNQDRVDRGIEEHKRYTWKRNGKETKHHPAPWNVCDQSNWKM